MLNFFAGRIASSKDDLLSGITVALALVPEAIAFAFVAGVAPHVGLYSAIIVGLITSIFGGRPGMISGATGAMAVVVVGLVHLHGINYLIPAVVLCGLFQIMVGVAKLGKFIRLVPHSVMLGFVNGLAIVIFTSQFGSLTYFSSDGLLRPLSGTPLALMLLLILLTMGIITFLPKITKVIPSSLAAILSVTVISYGINEFSNNKLRITGLDNAVLTVEDMLVSKLKLNEVERHKNENFRLKIESVLDEAEKRNININQSNVKADSEETYSEEQILKITSSIKNAPRSELPVIVFFNEAINLPPFNFDTIKIIFPFALILAGVGLIESLMTLTLIDEITGTRGKGNKECIGQGLANVTCGLFGGMGGCAMIGQSLINVNSGGRGRMSGITSALILFVFIIFLQPLILVIPMAALVGVMFMVVIGTFEWSTLHTWRKIPTSDVLVMILVAGYTVIYHNLAIAVLLGVIVQALVFAWKHATHIFADTKINEFGSRIYQLHGPLFFASSSTFTDLFDAEKDPNDVVIDFYYTRVYDQSGLEAIGRIADKYRNMGKRLHLRHLSNECKDLLDKAEDIVEVNLSEDPNYHVASDRLG
jgi:SulP family sulfate permease